MASFIQNWWDKHDMDQDGKGCFFIFLVMLGVAALIAAAVVGTAAFFLVKATAC